MSQISRRSLFGLIATESLAVAACLPAARQRILEGDLHIAKGEYVEIVRPVTLTLRPQIWDRDDVRRLVEEVDQVVKLRD